MPRPHRNRFDRLAPRLWLGLFLAQVLVACSPDCTSVCEKHQTCMGPEAGNLEGCIAQCDSQEFEAKDAALQCIEDSSCEQIAAGTCAPTCAEVCTRAQSCDIATDAQCSETCASLSYAQQECYIVNPCSVVRESCASLAATTTTEP